MKISTKSRYGLRAMVDLAVYSGAEQLSLNTISKRQDVSVNYLEQIFSSLRKAGLVKSVKGAQGGYVLADHPEKITVGMVLRVLEGELSVAQGNQADSDLNDFLSRKVWQRVDESVIKTADSITLEDLANEYRAMNENVAGMYYI
ncbi:MAG: RrF2 family transcriptional regulator [Clostridia bacterium]|nr:Rrf2 family transcriptional regulator [Clostridiaceae bacterium]